MRDWSEIILTLLLWVCFIAIALVLIVVVFYFACCIYNAIKISGSFDQFMGNLWR